MTQPHCLTCQPNLDSILCSQRPGTFLPRVPPIPALDASVGAFRLSVLTCGTLKSAHSTGLQCCAVFAVNSLCESPLPNGRSVTLVLTFVQRPYAHHRMSRRGFRLLQSRYATTKVLLSKTMRFFRLPLVPGIPSWNSLFFAFFSVHSSWRYPFRHSRRDGLEERRRDNRKQALVGKVRALSTL